MVQYHLLELLKEIIVMLSEREQIPEYQCKIMIYSIVNIYI
jgi:hypothetical protein